MGATLSPASALERGDWAPEGLARDTVGTIKFSETPGKDFDCTATAIAPTWALTARHCLEGLGSTAGFMRFSDGKQTDQVHLSDGAKSQPGDSGGPLFVDNKLGGVATAALTEDPNAEKAGTVGIHPLSEQIDWVNKQIGQDAPQAPEQMAQNKKTDIPVVWTAISCAFFAAVLAVFLFVRRKQARG